VEVLPAPDAATGWQVVDEPAVYDTDTLYDFMNGAADLYFTYGFEELAVGQYTDDQGNDVEIQVYRVASDPDAYGLFTYSSYGEPADIGIDGEQDPGYRLAFWTDRTYVQIVARDEVDDAALRRLGEATAAALPGSGRRPALVEALPAEAMQPGSARFFRSKMALDNLLWLGSEDVLGLGADVEGVVARYEAGDQILDLLLVTFPDTARAESAQEGLLQAGPEELITLEVRGNTLGAAFGSADLGSAQALLQEAMEGL
jgi:hypothetical protein